jgi:hypothetical protein
MWKQPVLFILDGTRLYLFYHGNVYTISMSKLLATQPGHRLPEPKTSSSKAFIWSLFDIRKQEEPELLLVTTMFTSADNFTSSIPIPDLG